MCLEFMSKYQIQPNLNFNLKHSILTGQLYFYKFNLSLKYWNQINVRLRGYIGDNKIIL